MINVGFDFDGVIIYNPLHIARAPIAWIKRKFFHLTKTSFYKPKNKFQLFVWRLLFAIEIPARDGLKELQKLKNEGKINPILLTGRFDLSPEKIRKILTRAGFPDLFTEIITNSQNEQPHLFKEKLIIEKKMEIYVEDNIDIVLYLSRNHYLDHSSVRVIPDLIGNLNNRTIDSRFRGNDKMENNKYQILWIFNLLDRRFDYSPKFPTLLKAVKSLSI